LQPGDRVQVPMGQAFAADGTLLEGRTEVDESWLTGESRARPKTPGDSVAAGSLNLRAPVLMRVQRSGADTRYEAIVALMRAARTQRPALLASADRWAAPFLWTVLLLAAGAGALWSVIDPALALRVVVSVLVVTCPCALSLAAPAALLATTGAMGRRGLLLRRLDAVQGLARMQTLFLDKTGTLTDAGQQRVSAQRLAAAGTMRADALQGIAASLAAWSSHPLCVALRAAAPPEPMAWRRVREVPGQGLEALDHEDQIWRLGAASWVGAEGLEATTAPDAAQAWLGRGGKAVLRLRFEECLRPDARAAVQALQADGVRLCLLSGDAPARVRRIADALGVADAVGGLSPEAKLEALAAAQGRGETVAMLGDGINDAPVLARADVSIAMGEGAGIARMQADAVLLGNRLQALADARRLARRTMRVVRQNLAWAAAYNAACIPLALAGWLPPWAAGVGMAASSLFVVANSMRLAR